MEKPQLVDYCLGTEVDSLHYEVVDIEQRNDARQVAGQSVLQIVFAKVRRKCGSIVELVKLKNESTIRIRDSNRLESVKLSSNSEIVVSDADNTWVQIVCDLLSRLWPDKVDVSKAGAFGKRHTRELGQPFEYREHCLSEVVECPV